MGKVLTFEEALKKEKELAQIVKQYNGCSHYIMHEDVIHSPWFVSDKIRKGLLEKGRGLVYWQIPSSSDNYLSESIIKMREITSNNPNITVILLPSNEAVEPTPGFRKTVSGNWNKLTDFMKKIGNKKVYIGGYFAEVYQKNKGKKYSVWRKVRILDGSRQYQNVSESRGKFLVDQDIEKVAKKPWLEERPRLFRDCVKQLEYNLARRGINIKYAPGFFEARRNYPKRNWALPGSPESEAWKKHNLKGKGLRVWHLRKRGLAK